MEGTQIKSSNPNNELLRAYSNTCIDASALSSKLYQTKGIPRGRIKAFKASFDYLAMITMYRREFSDNRAFNELVEKVNAWLKTLSNKPTREYAEEGLDLFKSYQKAMRDCNLDIGR
jgi:hypothetical protein